MQNLYLLRETFSYGLVFDSLMIISFIAILCAVFVIIEKNPIVSVLYLIGLFFSIAVYLMMLGITFIGLSYLLVYVGAVSILFLFILMLINVRISELVTDNNNSIPLAIGTGIIFASTFYHLLPSQSKETLVSFVPAVMRATKENSGEIVTPEMMSEVVKRFQENDHIAKNIPENFNIVNTSLNTSLLNEEILKEQNLSFVTSITWDGALTEFSHITSIGNILYTVYPMWLIITSLILLLAMVGAIVITVKQYE